MPIIQTDFFCLIHSTCLVLSLWSDSHSLHLCLAKCVAHFAVWLFGFAFAFAFAFCRPLPLPFPSPHLPLFQTCLPRPETTPATPSPRRVSGNEDEQQQQEGRSDGQPQRTPHTQSPPLPAAAVAAAAAAVSLFARHSCCSIHCCIQALAVSEIDAASRTELATPVSGRRTTTERHTRGAVWLTQPPPRTRAPSRRAHCQSCCSLSFSLTCFFTSSV